jgi:hypothetical protein
MKPKHSLWFTRSLTENQKAYLIAAGCGIKQMNKQLNTWIGYQGYAVTVGDETQFTAWQLVAKPEDVCLEKLLDSWPKLGLDDDGNSIRMADDLGENGELVWNWTAISQNTGE